MNKVLLTGGTGFFGKSLLDAWRTASPKPCDELVILSRDPETFRRRHPEFAPLPGVRFLAGDIRTFQLHAEPFDAIIHAATPASLTVPDAEMTSIIVDGTRRVIEEARRSGVRRILLTSSGAVYGPQPPDCFGIAEDAPPAPVTAYGQGKLAAEKLLLESGIPTVIARCFAFVGRYLPLDIHFAAGNFLRNRLNQEPIVIQGDGRPYRSYLAASDLVRQLWTLLEHGRAGEAYNVGSEHAVAIRELAEIIAVLEEPHLPVRIAGRHQAGPPPRYVPSTAKYRAEFGNGETMNLETALRETLAGLRR